MFERIDFSNRTRLILTLQNLSTRINLKKVMNVRLVKKQPPEVFCK